MPVCITCTSPWFSWTNFFTQNELSSFSILVSFWLSNYFWSRPSWWWWEGSDGWRINTVKLSLSVRRQLALHHQKQTPSDQWTPCFPEASICSWASHCCDTDVLDCLVSSCKGLAWELWDVEQDSWPLWQEVCSTLSQSSIVTLNMSLIPIYHGTSGQAYGGLYPIPYLVKSIDISRS